MDARISQWAAVVDQEILDGSVTFTSSLRPGPTELPRAIAVTHMFNQLTTLLSQLGIDAGVTDLPWVVRNAKAESQA